MFIMQRWRASLANTVNGSRVRNVQEVLEYGNVPRLEVPASNLVKFRLLRCRILQITLLSC